MDFSIFENIFSVWTVAVVVLCLMFTMDDFFIDLVAMIRRLGPYKMKSDEFKKLKELNEKRIAIIVANWKEYEVIEPMIRGNLKQIDYDNYCFFLGVYPNDTLTVEAAQRLSEKFPHKVQVVINTLEGPTSKGQMLNEMVRQIIFAPDLEKNRFDYFLMQDSEDVLHRHHLSLLNYYSQQADFIQTPVFSFNRELSAMVGGVYIDEFAEHHTKDMFVRENMGAAVPSAGVGTFLSRHLMLEMMKHENGNFLKEDTLTEDYHLGLMTKRLGFKSKFICVELQHDTGKKELIATREYFPNKMQASIRQKTRWTLGIAFQGAKNLGWEGSLVDKYFILRDRRGPINALLILQSVFILAIILGYRYGFHQELPAVFHNTIFTSAITLNALSMIWRILVRMKSVHRTNGLNQVLMVAPRWLLGNYINSMAAFNAYETFKKSEKTGERPKWVKTDHELPKNFGQENEAH